MNSRDDGLKCPVSLLKGDHTPKGGPAPSARIIAPPQSSILSPSLSRYHAPSACGFALWKNTPPNPVIRAIDILLARRMLHQFRQSPQPIRDTRCQAGCAQPLVPMHKVVAAYVRRHSGLEILKLPPSHQTYPTPSLATAREIPSVPRQQWRTCRRKCRI